MTPERIVANLTCGIISAGVFDMRNYLALGAALIALMGLCATSLAHGDAAWIMQNPAYKDQNGIHCCGPSDCKREKATDFREAPEGIYVTTASGELLMPRSLVGRGLYPSIDDGWWICARAGVVKCVFKPTTGF